MPLAIGTVQRAGHVGVVIAGHDRHPIGRAEILQPHLGAVHLLAGGEVDEVAGDGHVVGAVTLHVGDELDQRVAEHGALPVALPVDVAGDALGRELPIGEFGKRAEMDVGKMGKAKHRPIVRVAALKGRLGGIAIV